MTLTNTTTVGPTTDSPEATNSPEATTTPKWIPFVEPVPDWEEAMETYGLWWDVHVYGVAVLFLMVTVYSLFNIIYLIKLHRKKELRNVQQTAFFIAITILMLVFSVERAIFMLLDPYNIKGTIPPPVAYLFISIGLPCMTSCFFLIFYAFYKVTRRRLARRSILSVKVLVAVIVLHFVISVSLDLGAGFNIYPVYLLLICQGLFIFCGIFLGIMFIILFVRIYRQSVTERRRMIRIASLVSDTLPGITDSTSEAERSRTSLRSLPQPKVTAGGKLILVSAILLLAISALYLFGLFGVFLGETLTGIEPNLWLWFGWEFSVRIMEVCLCWTISLAGTQPAIRNFRKKRSHRRRQSEILLAERRRSEASLAGSIRDAENGIQSKEDKIGLANDALENQDSEEPVSTERRVSFSVTIPSPELDSTEKLSTPNKRKGSLVPPTTPETIFESAPDLCNHKVLEKNESAPENQDSEEPVSTERPVSFSESIPSIESDSTEKLSTPNNIRGSLVPPTTPETISESVPDVCNHQVLENSESANNGDFEVEEEKSNGIH